MPIAPKEFYEDASAWYKESAIQQRESLRRSVISRAYYAAFLQARSKAGLQNDQSGSVHKNTGLWFGARSGLYPGVANRLDALKIARGQADYDLNKAIPLRAAAQALQWAEAILKALGGI